MEDPELLNDVRFLRDVVEKTQPPAVNRFWPVTFMWGVVVTATFIVCAFLGTTGRLSALPWVWPVVLPIAWLLHWYIGRRVRMNIQEHGVRPQFRKDLALCWGSIGAIGLLWTAAMVMTGVTSGHWYVLLFVWASLHFVGYIINGILISREWFWVAGLMLAWMIATFLSGFLGSPDSYWLVGWSIPATYLMAGILGWRNARLHVISA